MWAGGAMTFFDDVINAPVVSPTGSLPELDYELLRSQAGSFDDSDQSSDPEMDLDLPLPLLRCGGHRVPSPHSHLESSSFLALITHPRKLDTIDTINLMIHNHNNHHLPNTSGPPLTVQTHSHTHRGNTEDLHDNQQRGSPQDHRDSRHHGQGHSLSSSTTASSSDNTNGNNNHHHQHNNHNNGNNNNNNNNNGDSRSDDQGSTSSPDNNQQNQATQRRKKASRACFHCQKAHLTCDDSRPCQRCVKRDLAATCADGVRKKAKYLQDAFDAQQQQQAAEQSNQTSQRTMSLSGMSDQQQILSDQAQQQHRGSMEESPLNDTASLFNFPMSSDYGFGSEAVNLEYSIISTMLSSPTADINPMSELAMVENWQRQGSLDGMANPVGNNHALPKPVAHNNAPPLGSGPPAVGLNNNTGHNPSALASAANGLAGAIGATNNAGHHNNGNAPTSVFQHPGAARVSKRKFPSNTPENVYANTKQPFNYTDGFHYLLRYVRERMDKEEMMRICRAMAMFRPSFIALIMNLTPEDLIFMEKCFQRTILEFEKLISFSGTPTVVWRRTGEIALVGKEFSLLTQWGRDQLVGKKTYIYELMDNQSAVEYWEKFSTHAFENTEQTVMTTCILLSPTNRVVPCTFCFTIKRDIFDIPLAIVGNFLPILS